MPPVERTGFWSLTLALCLAACGDVAGTGAFRLELVPRLLEGQEPFADEPSVKLVLQRPGEAPEVVLVGGAAGKPVVAGQDALVAGTVVGLVADFGPDDAIDLPSLRAWGCVVLQDELAVDGDAARHRITMPEFDSAAPLGLTDHTSQLAGLAVLPGGDALVFGGTGNLSPDAAGVRTVRRLRDLDDGDWELATLDVSLPEPLLGLTATALHIAGDARILVAGGRPERGELVEGQSRFVGLYDPVLDDWVWTETLGLKTGRSEHTAIRLADARVLLVGGYTDDSGTFATYEVFDAATRTSSEVVELGGVGPLGLMLAPLGENEVLLCGGGVVDEAGAEPQDGCFKIDLHGNPAPTIGLPYPLMEASMTPIAGERVLLTGGLSTFAPRSDQVPAEQRSWYYEGSQWTQVFDLGQARAQHVSVPLPDGRVLVLGGVGVGGAVLPTPESARHCFEIYDHDTKQFAESGCADGLGGADVHAAWWPGEHAIVTEGWVLYDGVEAGGKGYGVVGRGPTL